MKTADFFRAVCVGSGIALSAVALTVNAQPAGSMPDEHSVRRYPTDANASPSTRVCPRGGEK